MIITNIKKISQTFIIKVHTQKEFEKCLLHIKNYSLGGIILESSLYNDLNSLKNLIEDIHKADQKNKNKVLIGIEKLPNDFHQFSKLSTLFNKSSENIKRYAYTYADIIHSLGCNLYLGPNLDLKSSYNKTGIHSNSRRVCEGYDLIAPGFKKYHILTIVKHFPGIGNTKFIKPFTPCVKNYPTKDLTPLEHAIKTRCNALLLGRVVIKGSKLKPITESEYVIKEILRKDYKYNGLIVSKNYNKLFTCNIKRKLLSGNDLIITNYYQGIFNNIKRLAKIAPNINESYNRIITYKEKYPYEKFKDIDINKINKLIDKANN